MVVEEGTSLTLREAFSKRTLVEQSWAVKRGWVALKPGGWCSEPLVGLRVICWAEDMLEKDLRDNRSIGDLGAHHLLKWAAPQGGKVTVLTHCNTGALATAGYGTALGEWASTGMGEGPLWMKEKETQTT